MTPPLRRPGRAVRGFSLIEVLLALALAGMAFTVLNLAFANILTSLAALQVETDYQPVVRFVRTQVLLEPDREKLEEGGEIETLDFGTARWEAEVEEALVSDLFQLRLRIELNPPEAREPEVFQETILVLRPTWSDPVDRSKIFSENRDRLEKERLEKGVW